MITDSITRRSNGFRRVFYLVGGSASLLIGIIGIVVPILPTTPFLLLSAFCYSRSSVKIYNWLLTNRWFGVYLSRYRDKQGIPLRVKLSTLAFLWGSIAVSGCLLVSTVQWWMYVALLLTGFGISLHLLMLKTDKRQ